MASVESIYKRTKPEKRLTKTNPLLTTQNLKPLIHLFGKLKQKNNKFEKQINEGITERSRQTYGTFI